MRREGTRGERKRELVPIRLKGGRGAMESIAPSWCEGGGRATGRKGGRGGGLESEEGRGSGRGSEQGLGG